MSEICGEPSDEAGGTDALSGTISPFKETVPSNDGDARASESDTAADSIAGIQDSGTVQEENLTDAIDHDSVEHVSEKPEEIIQSSEPGSPSGSQLKNESLVGGITESEPDESNENIEEAEKVEPDGLTSETCEPAEDELLDEHENMDDSALQNEPEDSDPTNEDVDPQNCDPTHEDVDPENCDVDPENCDVDQENCDVDPENCDVTNEVLDPLNCDLDDGGDYPENGDVTKEDVYPENGESILEDPENEDPTGEGTYPENGDPTDEAKPDALTEETFDEEGITEACNDGDDDAVVEQEDKAENEDDALEDSAGADVSEFEENPAPDGDCADAPEFEENAGPDDACADAPEFEENAGPDDACADAPEFEENAGPDDDACADAPEFDENVGPDDACAEAEVDENADLEGAGALEFEENAGLEDACAEEDDQQEEFKDENAGELEDIQKEEEHEVEENAEEPVEGKDVEDNEEAEKMEVDVVEETKEDQKCTENEDPVSGEGGDAEDEVMEHQEEKESAAADGAEAEKPDGLNAEEEAEPPNDNPVDAGADQVETDAVSKEEQVITAEKNLDGKEEALAETEHETQKEICSDSNVPQNEIEMDEENEEECNNNKEQAADEESMQVDEIPDDSVPHNEESLLEGSVQPEDSLPLDDASSPVVGLVNYPSDSEDIPEKGTEPVDPQTQTLVHAPCFEEDAQSSWSVDTAKTPAIKIKQLPPGVDEDSRASSVSQRSASKRPYSDDEILPTFSAEQLFEYRWPVDGGEFYFIQEHVSEFLQVKSFKRKYPDLVRRPVEVGEKRYLRDKGVVSETLCDLGLTAIRSDDVLELTSKDYPEKYQEYIQVLQDRERQKINNKHKEYSTPSIDKTKMNDFLMKAIKATAEFNMHLNQERREERRSSFDMQTFTIHIPANKILKLSKEETKVGKYPVALLPGQYQDYYRTYTAEELKYFPLNTVLYGPLKELPTVYTQPSSDGSQSDSEDSSDGCSCSSSPGSHDSGDSSSGSESAGHFKTEPNVELQVPPLRIKDRLTTTCKVCHGTHERNKEGYPEELIHCSECGSSGHPSCLDVTSEMVEAIRTYAWQCIDCKTCMLCMDPYDEDKMMFCDKCDRGYHTFCVGLKNLPNGRWICQLCGQCSGCGTRTPGPEGSKAQWQQDLSKNAADKKPHLLCLTCAKTSKR